MRLITTSQAQRQNLSEAEIAGSNGTILGEDDKSAQLLDKLCLALGLLTNLVQSVSSTKRLIHDDRTSLPPVPCSCVNASKVMSVHCPGKRSCISVCACISRTSFLRCLAHVYIQLCQSANDLDTVVRGHIAILFGLLMQDDWDNQTVLLNVLPGETKRRKLDSLLENAREFTAFYVRFAKKAAEVVHGKGNDDQESDNEDDNAARSEGALGIQRVLQDEKGEDVAKSVIIYLERLRMHLPDAC